MLTTIIAHLRKVEKHQFFLHNVARFYRFLRLFCVLLEDRYEMLSWKAGFKVSIAWTENLGWDHGEDVRFEFQEDRFQVEERN